MLLSIIDSYKLLESWTEVNNDQVHSCQENTPGIQKPKLVSAIFLKFIINLI